VYDEATILAAYAALRAVGDDEGCARLRAVAARQTGAAPRTFAEATNHEALAAGLGRLAAPEHAFTRQGDHPQADHVFRGRLADLLDDHDRPDEAALLRDPGRHVVVHGGRVVPGRYTLDHLHAARDAAIQHIERMMGGDYPYDEEIYHPHERPGRVLYLTSLPGQPGVPRERVLHASDLPTAVAYHLRARANRQIPPRNPDPAARARLEPELERRLTALRRAPVEEPADA
jgi:hypothetical protein